MLTNLDARLRTQAISIVSNKYNNQNSIHCSGFFFFSSYLSDMKSEDCFCGSPIHIFSAEI